MHKIKSTFSHHEHLNLIHIDWSQSGHYRCQAENYLGMVFAETEIIVLGESFLLLFEKKNCFLF